MRFPFFPNVFAPFVSGRLRLSADRLCRIARGETLEIRPGKKMENYKMQSQQGKPLVLLMLNDLEQTEILKAIGLSQGFEVRVLEDRGAIPREWVSRVTQEDRPTLAIVELEFLHREGISPEVLARMMTAGLGQAKLLLSQSHQLVIRGAQAQWAKDQGAIGLLPSLSAHRLHEQIAEQLAPAFAVWNQAVNWSRAQSFASMVPAGLGRSAELKNAHRLLAELNSRAISLKQIALWARDEGGFEVSDRRWRLNAYPRCFVGSQATEFLMERIGCDADKAVRIAEQLRVAGVLHHVAHEHAFEHGDFYYRFYTPGEAARRVRLLSLVKHMVAPEGVTVRERIVQGEIYANCISGQELVAWLQGKLKVSADEAVQLGQFLLELGLLGDPGKALRFRNAEALYRFSGLAEKQLKQARAAPSKSTPTLAKLIEHVPA
jgi:Domain found in Dishevelled, Egl-10, and Pleckstrin (DEP)